VISDHIDKTKDFTEGGRKELVEAEKHQIAARKKRCYLILILVAILIVILALGGYFGGLFGKS
jgi:flagellar basal body-associated protein FliL